MEVIREFKGSSNTSCVTLITPKKSVDELNKFIHNEYSTSINIKDKSNRKSVQESLKAISNVLSKYRELPNSGLAIFAHSSI